MKYFILPLCSYYFGFIVGYSDKWYIWISFSLIGGYVTGLIMNDLREHYARRS